MTSVSENRAMALCRAAASRRAMNAEHANWFAHALVRTSLVGIDTHGLRLLPLYLRELEEGRSRPKPNFQVRESGGATLMLDADHALGTVAATHAAHLVSELAKRNGVGVVSVANSNHFGATYVYGELIAQLGLIGMVTTSAAARMAPFNGRSPMFGTNPICFSAPLTGGRAFVFDMATSQISYSQIKHYRQQGLELPVGWALGEDGEPTTHPEHVFALSPLGGYKGQGLAMLVQILSCLLPAMPLDRELEHLDTGSFKQGRQIGHFFLAIDPGRFVEPGMFLQNLEQLLHGVRAAPARKGQQVLVAGDPQQSCWQTRRELGIPLNADEERAFLTEEGLCRAAGYLPSLSEEAL